MHSLQILWLVHASLISTFRMVSIVVVTLRLAQHSLLACSLPFGPFAYQHGLSKLIGVSNSIISDRISSMLDIVAFRLVKLFSTFGAPPSLQLALQPRRNNTPTLLDRCVGLVVTASVSPLGHPQICGTLLHLRPRLSSTV